MNKNSIPVSYFHAVVVVLLPVLLALATTTASSATNTADITPTPNPTVNDQTALTRQDIMDIAERYAGYKWRAINSAATDWASISLYDPTLTHTFNDAPNDPRRFPGVHITTPDKGWCDRQIGVPGGFFSS